jgi:hypothetical protein
VPKPSPAKTKRAQPIPIPFRPFPAIRRALEGELQKRPGVSRNYLLNEKLAVAFRLPRPDIDEVDGRRARNQMAA